MILIPSLKPSLNNMKLYKQIKLMYYLNQAIFFMFTFKISKVCDKNHLLIVYNI